MLVKPICSEMIPIYVNMLEEKMEASIIAEYVEETIFKKLLKLYHFMLYSNDHNQFSIALVKLYILPVK